MNIKRINLILTSTIVLANICLSHSLFSSKALFIVSLLLTISGIITSFFISQKFFKCAQMTVDFYLLIISAVLMPLLFIKALSLAKVINLMTKLLLLYSAGFSFLLFKDKNAFTLIILSSLLFYCALFLKIPLSINPLYYVFIQFILLTVFLQTSYSYKLIQRTDEAGLVYYFDIKKTALTTLLFALPAIIAGSILHTTIPRMEKSPFEILGIKAPFANEQETGVNTSPEAEELTYDLKEGGLGEDRTSKFDELLKSGEISNIIALQSETAPPPEEKTKENLPKEQQTEKEEAVDKPENDPVPLSAILISLIKKLADIFLIPIIIIFVIFSYFKLRKFFTLKIATENPKRFIISLYMILIATAKSTGIKIPKDITPEEHIRLFTQNCNKSGQYLKNIVDIFQKARYSNIIISAEDARDFSALYSIFLTNFLGSLPLHKRAIARLVAVKIN